MADDLLDLLSEPIQFRDDLYRNIRTCRESQDLFDDLTDDPNDFDVAIRAEARTRPPSIDQGRTRAFDDVIDYPFNNLAETRFSDGTFGIFYSSVDLDTTISETIYHWLGFLYESDFLSSEVIGERRVYLVGADATLFDCRDKSDDYPDLIHPHDYTFTHKVGEYIRDEDRDGLLTKSARCDGINAPIFRSDRLNDSRIICHLTYKLFPGDGLVIVEREQGITYREVSWDDIGFVA